jgi:hypothetical protein
LSETQKADPAAQRLAMWLVAIAAVGALPVILLRDRWLAALGPQTLPLVGTALLAPLAGFAFYFWRLGSRIVGAGRFPPLGMRVVRDMVVVHGAAARQRGRILQVFAAALIVLMVGMLAALWRLVSLLDQRAGP